MGMTLFGGKKESANNANNASLSGKLGGAVDGVGQSMGALQALLGGDSSGFRRFTDAIDLSGQMEMGSRGVTGNAAARGLLRSGSTGKALVNYEQQMENQAANSYMERLLGVGQMGLGAAGVLAETGKQSKSREKPGMGQFIGQMAAGAAASDERLKTDITAVGKNRDGLTVYQYRYKGSPEVYTGVMAQEVAKVKPEALGPTVNGYMTVDYGKVDVINLVEEVE